MPKFGKPNMDDISGAYWPVYVALLVILIGCVLATCAGAGV